MLAELGRTLEAGREGGEALTLMDARAMEWEARVLERGREQGIAQGREQGIAQGRAEERALLRRQAERRFGAETAGQVSELLVGDHGRGGPPRSGRLDPGVPNRE